MEQTSKRTVETLEINRDRWLIWECQGIHDIKYMPHGIFVKVQTDDKGNLAYINLKTYLDVKTYLNDCSFRPNTEYLDKRECEKCQGTGQRINYDGELDICLDFNCVDGYTLHPIRTPGIKEFFIGKLYSDKITDKIMGSYVKDSVSAERYVKELTGIDGNPYVISCKVIDV